MLRSVFDEAGLNHELEKIKEEQQGERYMEKFEKDRWNLPDRRYRWYRTEVLESISPPKKRTSTPPENQGV